jgi:Cft2 family RNA processing exonuclease
MEHFEDIGPSVVLASPGMMQSGLSRELFENWCTDKRNGVIIAGYCVEGTLAKVCHTLYVRYCVEGTLAKVCHTLYVRYCVEAGLTLAQIK